MGLLDKIKKVIKDSNENTSANAKNKNQKVTEYRDNKGNLVYTHVDTYNDEGKIIHKTCYMANGTIDGDYDISYNSFGKRTKGCWYAVPSGYLMFSEITYDDMGKMIEIKNYGSDSHNVVGNKTLNHYDKNGRLEYTEYCSAWHENGSQNNTSKDYMIYNDAGQLIEKDTYNYANIKILQWNYQYDDKGNRFKEICIKDCKTEFYDVHTFDENNNVIETRRFNGNDELVSVTKK